MPETSATPTSASSKSRSSRWAVAAVLITLLLVGGFLTYHLIEMPVDVVKGLKGAFPPLIQNNYETKITGAIHDLKSNPKLVVLTASIDTEVRKSSSTTALWVYWGTTSVDVKARDNKVQFYVPLEDIGTSNFSYDDVHKILTLRTRPPILDDDFVDVQSNPDKIEVETTNGWAKLDRFSGAALREDAKRELRNAVLTAVKAPAQYELLELKARANAREQIIRLLDPLTSSLKPDVKVEVEFFDQ